MESKRTINISTGIIFRTIAILIGLWFVYFIRDIIALVFIAIVIVAAIDPIVNWLQRKKIRRSVGVLLVYFLIIILIGLFFSFLIPPIVQQFGEFSSQIPNFSGKIDSTSQGINTFFQTQHLAISTQSLLQDLSGQLSNLSGNIFTTTIGVFSGLVSAILILVMAFYMAVKEDGIKHFIISITPEKHKEYASSLSDRIKTKIGRWTLGQLFLMFLIFCLDLTALLILGVPYALVIAIFGGLVEIVPYIGPVLALVPAVVAGLFVSPLTGLLVLIAYVVIQQLEGHIIIPQLMSKAVGLHPIAIVLALLIGFKLGGVLGAILAIPVATAISVFVGDLFAKPKEA